MTHNTPLAFLDSQNKLHQYESLLRSNLVRLIQFPVDRNYIEAKVLTSPLLFSLTKVHFAVSLSRLSFTFIVKALRSPLLTRPNWKLAYQEYLLCQSDRNSKQRFLPFVVLNNRIKAICSLLRRKSTYVCTYLLCYSLTA